MQHFVFSAFVNMAASDLHALQAALLLPPERLGEVCCCAISCTPIPALLGGHLSENEAGQLVLRPWPPLKEWECCLRLLKNHGRHRFGRLTCPELPLLHLQGKPFFHPPGRLLWELAVLMRAAYTILADTSWAWESFLTFSCQSFSNSVAISAMQVIVLRFLWSATAAAVSYSSPLEKTLLFCILVRAWSW